jgi:hypothetical protein
MKARIMVLTVIPATILSSCNLITDCIDGNGMVRSEERTTTEITAIANETSFDVIYVKGDETSVIIEAESNIMPYIETEINGDELDVSTSGGHWCLRYTIKPVITVTAPFVSELVNAGSGDIIADQLEGEEIKVIDSGSGDITTGAIGCTNAAFTVTGSGNISTDAINASSLKAALSGSGNLTIKGNAATSILTISGSGSIFAGDLKTGESQITISGSGSIHATVLEYLKAVLSGSGNIYLYGDPEISLTRTGSGRIINL